MTRSPRRQPIQPIPFRPFALLLGVAALAGVACAAGGPAETGAAGKDGSAAGTGGSIGSAGTTGSSGTTGTAGAGARGGTTGSGGAGTTGAAGITGSSGTTGGAGTTGAAGTAGAGAGTTGGAGRGGTTGSAGRGGTTGAAGTGGGGSNGACGATTLNLNPFGCKVAWGTNDPGGSLASYSYLQFMSYWVEPTVKADGTFPSCSACSWLSGSVASTNIVPVYYAYFIGFYGHANGLPDGNLGCPNGQSTCQKLTTAGAALIKNNRAKIIQMYADYARQTYAVWKTKPLVWLLEGDFIQYNDSAQSSPLTMSELAKLAADITCAIKSNMPNAVVAMNHTTWNGDDETRDFWNAMKSANLDLVWTTGVANNNGYLEASTTASTYNHATATYAYLHELTGKTIFVDTSFGASMMADTWSSASAATLNQRIAEGVIAINVNPLPSNYQTSINAVGSQLSGTCR